MNGTPFGISYSSAGSSIGDLVSGTPFDAVEFFTTSTSHSFAVGYLAAGAAPVPEASSAFSFGLLLALGLGGVVLRRHLSLRR